MAPNNKDNIFRISASILSVLVCYGACAASALPEKEIAATIGTALANTLSGIGTNLLSDHLNHYSRKFFDKVTADGIFNSSIEKAMQQALQQALQQTQAICINHFSGKEKNINDFFTWLNDESSGAFLDVENTNELGAILAQVNARQLSEDNLRLLLEEHTGFNNQYQNFGLDTEFARVFWLHLPQQYSFYFKEELKQGTEAMQSVQLLFIDMSITLLREVKRTGEDTNERVRMLDNRLEGVFTVHGITRQEYDDRLKEIGQLQTLLKIKEEQLIEAQQKVVEAKHRLMLFINDL